MTDWKRLAERAVQALEDIADMQMFANGFQRFKDHEEFERWRQGRVEYYEDRIRRGK